MSFLLIGIPRECKPKEGRVGLTPQAAAGLVLAGHDVAIETKAGLLSGFSDQDYRDLGIKVLPDAASLYEYATLIVKVKEPVEKDLALLTSKHILFSFLHLAPNPELLRQLLSIGLTAIAFESVERHGKRPLLAPMSEIAGRLAVQAGAQYLHSSEGGKGILLGGATGAPPGKVVVLGAGMAGQHATHEATAYGADVVVFDNNMDALRQVKASTPHVTGLYSHSDAVSDYVMAADLVIGAVLLPDSKAPRLVSKANVKAMAQGSVIVDIAIDQGGCVETMRPTDYDNPVYVKYGVIHMGVTNLPGAVPRTASQALSSAITPFVHLLADGGLDRESALFGVINVQSGKIIHPCLKDCLKP